MRSSVATKSVRSVASMCPNRCPWLAYHCRGLAALIGQGDQGGPPIGRVRLAAHQIHVLEGVDQGSLA